MDKLEELLVRLLDEVIEEFPESPENGETTTGTGKSEPWTQYMFIGSVYILVHMFTPDRQ